MLPHVTETRKLSAMSSAGVHEWPRLHFCSCEHSTVRTSDSAGSVLHWLPRGVVHRQWVVHIQICTQLRSALSRWRLIIPEDKPPSIGSTWSSGQSRMLRNFGIQIALIIRVTGLKPSADTQCDSSHFCAFLCSVKFALLPSSLLPKLWFEIACVQKRFCEHAWTFSTCDLPTTTVTANNDHGGKIGSVRGFEKAGVAFSLTNPSNGTPGCLSFPGRALMLGSMVFSPGPSHPQQYPPQGLYPLCHSTAKNGEGHSHWFWQTRVCHRRNTRHPGRFLVPSDYTVNTRI